MPCPSCRANLPAEMGICPNCGRPQHSPKTPFGALEARLADARADYKRGAIPSPEFEAIVAGLQLRDRSGAAWLLNGSGKWARWDGTRWAVAAPVVDAPRRRVVRWWIPLAGAVAVLGLVALAAGVFLYGGWVDYATSPMLVEDVQASDPAPAGYPLQPDQRAALAEHGYPEGFSILFFDRESADGPPEDVRLETWDFYSEGLRLTFANGELEEQEPLDVGPVADLAPLPYTPEQFVAYMTLDDVLAAAGLERYVLVPLERQVVANGTVYYADALTFGLKDGELRYVEALAVEGEG